MDLLSLVPVLGKVLDRIIPDPAAAAAAKLKLLDLQQAGDFKAIDADLEIIRGQVAINVEEAKSPAVFVSGWRPFLGWICAGGFGYSVLLLPLLSWVSLIAGWQAPPPIDTGTIVTLLIGMLGLGGARTVEKLAGVARKA